LTYAAGYIPRWFICPQAITHPSSNRARRTVTSFIRHNTLPLRLASNLIHSHLIVKEGQNHSPGPVTVLLL